MVEIIMLFSKQLRNFSSVLPSSETSEYTHRSSDFYRLRGCLSGKGILTQEVRVQVGKAGTVLMDLSKAFDCIRHDLLIAKLHAYGFSHDVLSFINDYFTNRQQRKVPSVLGKA